MKLNKNDLSKLKGSDDFEYIRKILIELKNADSKSNWYKEYIKDFQHYRLYMKPTYICDTDFYSSGVDIIDRIIKEALIDYYTPLKINILI